MSQVEDYAARLAEGIGARPAGTVEEQQAALMIEKVLLEEIGLKTETEEFNCNPDFELPKTICAIATVVLGVLSLFLPLMVIPSIIITLITAVVFALEVVGNAPVSSAIKRGVSQNIVGKYIPEASADVQSGRQARKRKVIIVSHYDTGKVRFELADPIFKVLPVLAWVEVAGMALVPILLFIRLVSTATEGLLVFFNVLIVICIVIDLIPVVFYILHQTAQFNIGANCNASGVAVMLETARRVGVEFPKMAAEEAEAVLHGEDALYEEGLVPEGAELSYDEVPEGGVRAGASREGDALTISLSDENASAMPYGSEQGSDPAQYGEESHVTFFGEENASPNANQAVGMAGATANAGAASPDMPAVSTQVVMQEPEEDDDPNVPDWYKAARKRANANKTGGEAHAVSAQRSKFADALDAAAVISSNALHQMETTDAGLSPVEQRLQQMRQSILGNADNANRAAVQPTAGVDGYLSNTTDAPNYESSMEAADASAVQVDEAEVASVKTDTSRTEDASKVVVDAAESAKAQEEEALAREQANLEAQAKANRTISFIPVEVDPEDIFQQNESLKTGNINQNEVAAQVAKKADGKAKSGRRSISLPSLSGAIAPVKEAHVQPAPLAEDGEAKVKSKRSRQEAISITLPSTTSDSKKSQDKKAQANKAQSAKPQAAKAQTEATKSESKAPSSSANVDAKASTKTDAVKADAAKTGVTTRSSAGNSGARASVTKREASRAEAVRNKARVARGEVIEEEIDETTNESVSVAGSFISASETSSFKPIGDELVANMKEEDIYIEDADDTDYAEQITQTGALAGPGYVDMPKDRRSRMFGRFRRKKQDRDSDISLKDSLGVDDSFDARSVGAARGGWESFRKDADTSSPWDSDDDWNGGAFSRKNAESEAPSTRKRPKRGVNPFGNLPLSEEIVMEEREAIQQFKSGILDTEIWFVALGAELADNAGIKQFIQQHKDELRGSIVIDLDGLGAGNLTLIEEEGKVRRLKASARIKRYVNKAGSALGMRVESGKMNWRNSATYMIGKSGLPTIHLVGMENGSPARAGKADDTFENLNLETLEQNCDYLVELLRAI